MYFRLFRTHRTAWRYFSLLFLFSSLFLPPRSFAQDLDQEVEAVADNLQYLQAERKLVGTGNVVVTHGNVELTADRAEINVDTKEAHAHGHVVVRQRGGGTISGDEVSFDFKNRRGTFPGGRLFYFPWYGYGEYMEQVNPKKIVAKNIYFTSCDLPHPHYDVKAKKAYFYPGDKIVAESVVFRILETPVFWWPYLVIPLHQPPLDVKVGYTDDLGAFILVSKGIALTENIDGRVRADWYSERGFGLGGEIDYKFEQLGAGEVKLYGIRDDAAPNDRASNPFANEVRREKDRGRVTWKHKARLDPLTTLQLQWNELSDERFLQDFFEREHREEVSPQSYLSVTRNSDHYGLLAHIEKRTNRFQTVAEKLPELVFTWYRRPFYGTNFYYTHEEGFLNFDQTKAFSPDGPNTAQFFTNHEISYPVNLFRYYSIVPFVNFRDDWFTKSRSKEDGLNRYVAGGGVDARTRFYRTWDLRANPFGIEINQIRHVLEPVVAYNSIKIASVDPSKLVVTGRGDLLDHEDLVSFGIENRIQTKRKRGGSTGELARVDLVSFNAFLDYSFGPGSDLLRTRANKFTDARFETVLRPYHWFGLRVDTVYDLIDHEIFTNNLDLVFDPGRLTLSVSHRYTNDRSRDGRVVDNLVVSPPHLSLEDQGSSHQITVDAVYDLSTRWDLGAYVRWELSDRVLKEWEIRAQRDLHDWLLDFGFNIRNSDRTDVEKELNKGIFVQLRLKAMQEIELQTGHRASYAEPRIGRMVSGSNEAPPPPNLIVSPDAQYASLSAS